MSSRENIPPEVDDCVAVSPRVRPSLFWVTLCCFVLLFIFWPVGDSKRSVPNPGSPPIAALRELIHTIHALDLSIVELEKDLISTETSGALATARLGTVEQYYQQLSKLQEMRISRARRVQNYNGLAKARFSEIQKLTTDSSSAKGGFLPTGIR